MLPIRDELKNGFIAFFREFRENYSSIQKLTATFLMVMLLPFMAEGAAAMVGFFLLLPLGLFLGIIEHRIAPLWALVSFLIHVGGAIDIASDVGLLWKVIQKYLDYIDPASSDYQSKDQYNETEEILFVTRVFFTLSGAFPGMCILLQSGIAASGGGAIGVFLLAILWKFFMGLIRLALMLTAPYLVYCRLVTPGVERNEKIRWLIHLGELVLLSDLLWSGIPLGIQTGLELFIFHDKPYVISSLQDTQLFQTVKLIAMGVNIIGAAYYVYFPLLGWENFLPWYHPITPNNHTLLRGINSDSDDDEDPLLSTKA